MRQSLILLTAGFFAGFSLNTPTVQAQNNFQAPVVNGTVDLSVPAGVDVTLRSIKFIDYDGDGDMDVTALVERGTGFPSFNYNGDLSYLENTGSSSSPTYNPATPTTWANNVDYTYNGSDLSPIYHTLVDIDGDGDTDAFCVTETTKAPNTRQANTPRLIENSMGSFTLSSQTVDPLAPIYGIDHDGANAISTTSIVFADVDGDGDQDFFEALELGTLSYTPNIGTSTNPNFDTPITNDSLNTLWNLDLEISSPNVAMGAIAIADLDGDTDLDILMHAYYQDPATSQNEPRFFYYENVGTATSPDFASAIIDPFGLVTYSSSITDIIYNMDFVDIDDDGDLDLFAVAPGNKVLFFENDNSASTDSIEFASSTLSIAEDGGNATVTVNLSDPVLLGASVDVALVGGTATEGTDFTYSTTETATFPINDNTAQTITIAVTDDADVEGDETIILALTNVSGSAIGTVDTLTITITDNDVQTSVNDINNETTIQVYPNPFDQQLVIETESNEVAYLRIMDQLGRVVIEQTVNQETTVIDTKKLARGIYTVHIENEKTGTVRQGQFVKQ
ncbi:MAG: FG-GAP-like repeat-containing protein [Saprospiraceae bacterium]|nr:FG-GAP-like repeat-containing protein [Saprospiraceae bacterium]